MAAQASAPSTSATSAVKVISKTWARDSHDLFDFEAHQLHTQTFSVPKSTVCMRNGTEVQMVGERDAPPAGGDPLLRLVQRDGTFWDILARRPRGPRFSSFLGRSETSFDALTIDAAVLPSEKMLDIRKACKLNVADPLDPVGPAKIFRDNLETGAQCAEKIGSNLFTGSLGESSGTKFKGELPVELGGQVREDVEAIQDTCHDFASLLLHRLSRKENKSLNKVDAVRVLKSFGRCLESMGQGTTLLGCQSGGAEGEDEATCEKEVDKVQPSSNSKKLWLVVRDLVSSSHRLQEGDVIKLGRFKFRVRQLVASTYGGMQPELRRQEKTADEIIDAGRWQFALLGGGLTASRRLIYPPSCQLPVGLRYWPNFITEAEEAELIQAVDGPGAAWLRKIRRAQQFFGLVYYQTSQSVPELQPTAQSSAKQQRGRDLEELPSWLIPRLRSSGLFSEPGRGINQVQANEYLEDSGIGAHVEDPAAGETLVTLSLLRPVQLTLQRAEEGRPVHRDKRDPEDCIKVLLEPRSLFLLEGESRHDFTHAIRQSRRVPLRDGRVVIRDGSFRRVSLTFRGIVEDKRSSSRSDMPTGYETYVVPKEILRSQSAR
ncbi:ALKBH8 [Symbiodinium sp. CCMP2456]|nr:ALKBH8 [Symbiodinium sp. CCMP2456]